MKIKNVPFFQPYKYLGPVENGGGHLCSLVAVIVNCQLKVISSEQLCNQYNAHLAQHDHVRLLLLCQLGQNLAHVDWLERDQHWPLRHELSQTFECLFTVLQTNAKTNNAVEEKRNCPVLVKSVTALLAKRIANSLASTLLRSVLECVWLV